MKLDIKALNYELGVLISIAHEREDDELKDSVQAIANIMNEYIDREEIKKGILNTSSYDVYTLEELITENI